MAPKFAGETPDFRASDLARAARGTLGHSDCWTIFPQFGEKSKTGQQSSREFQNVRTPVSYGTCECLKNSSLWERALPRALLLGFPAAYLAPELQMHILLGVLREQGCLSNAIRPSP
eukprot:8065904-Pyramimonas_sp.AAC.1